MSVKSEFTRNIGVLDENQQNSLGATCIAVAGAGGVGGIHALTLARMGIGRFVIADPDEFEVVNINRQYGATHKTVGRNKAEVVAEMVTDINPDAEVIIMAERIGEENIDRFLSGVNIYVDGIDFFEIDARRIVFNSCRHKGIPALTAAPLGFGATLQVFTPDGMGFDEYFGIDDDTDYNEKIAAFASGLAPYPYHATYMDFSRVSMENRTGPAVSAACTLAASLVATEVVKIVTGKGEIRAVPHYLQVDLLLNKFDLGCIEQGGKSEQQLEKRKQIMEKFLGS